MIGSGAVDYKIHGICTGERDVLVLPVYSDVYGIPLPIWQCRDNRNAKKAVRGAANQKLLGRRHVLHPCDQISLDGN